MAVRRMSGAAVRLGVGTRLAYDVRAERGRPMSLTPLGARVAAAVQQLQQRP